MADVISYVPKKNKSWLNQYAATSGQMPSADAIDQMIQSELDAAYKNRYYSGALALQGKRDLWDQTKWGQELDWKNRELASRERMNNQTMSAYDRARESNERAQMLRLGLEGASGLLGWGLKPDPVSKETGFSQIGDKYNQLKNWWSKPSGGAVNSVPDKMLTTGPTLQGVTTPAGNFDYNNYLYGDYPALKNQTNTLGKYPDITDGSNEDWSVYI